MWASPSLGWIRWICPPRHRFPRHFANHGGTSNKEPSPGERLLSGHSPMEFQRPVGAEEYKHQHIASASWRLRSWSRWHLRSWRLRRGQGCVVLLLDRLTHDLNELLLDGLPQGVGSRACRRSPTAAGASAAAAAEAGAALRQALEAGVFACTACTAWMKSPSMKLRSELDAIATPNEKSRKSSRSMNQHYMHDSVRVLTESVRVLKERAS